MKKFNPGCSELLTGINLIEASAGTGKTYSIAMLALRFVVEQDLDIKNILVVTFTKAATEELKDRIRARFVEARNILTQNLSVADSNIKTWLDNLNLAPTLILQRINHALLDIDQASIFTIHGFCQRLLTEHALESSQLFDCELTGDISPIKQACTDDYWRKNIYTRSAWEVSLLTDDCQTPDALLASINYISPEQSILPEYQDLQQLLDQLKQFIQQHKPTIIQTLQRLQIKLEEGKFKSSFANELNSRYPYLLDWLNEKSAIMPDFSIFTFEHLPYALNGNKFRSSKKNPASSEEQKQDYLSSLNVDDQLFQQLTEQIKNIKLMFRRALMQTLREDMDKRMQQLNLLSFDDLINRLAKALKDKQGHSLIQPIRKQYKVAMIDEFQDTDQQQWYIFSTLFDNPEHALYLIGDPKQAIYKFRGADIFSYFAAKNRAHHHFNLSDNWRSHPHLVQAVNILFKKANPFYSEHLEFHPVDAALSSENGLLTKSHIPQPPLVLLQLDKTDKEFWTSAKAGEQIKTAVVNQIISLLTADYSIENNHVSAVQAKDIAILVRTNKQATDFQWTLNSVGITAVINSKQSVFSSSEAWDLYQLLQAIAQPGNLNLFKQALSLDWFGLNGQQLFQTLNDDSALDNYLSRFQDYLQTWQLKGLMAMMQQLLSQEKILPNLASHLMSERRMTNLQHCIELLQQAVIDEHLGITKSLDWLHHKISQSEQSLSTSDEQQLRLESDEDAVKIITMHSSKGLEFPIVFCPFLWQQDNRLEQEKNVIHCHVNGEMIVDMGSEQFEYHRQLAIQEALAEDLRVFYVATTRAKYRCYLYWADCRTKDQPNQSAMAYLLDLSAAGFSEQQCILQRYAQQHENCFSYQLIALEKNICDMFQTKSAEVKLCFQQSLRALYSHWQMSSYTALSSLSLQDAPEIPEDKAREQLDSQVITDEIPELPRGAQTGNVIHDLLENIPFSKLAAGDDISQQREHSCLRYGLTTENPEQIDRLLKNTVKTVFSTADHQFCLKQLDDHACVKEMPFYLSMKTMDSQQINRILSDCPTFQSLSTQMLSGYLTGFIDLICQYNGKFYVMDYKSNHLENYDSNSLIRSMHEHNYGLQYWLYTVVLHHYLQQRIPDYHYQQHFGGIKYLFVRGMNEKIENSGVYQTRPNLKKIEQLSALFI